MSGSVVALLRGINVGTARRIGMADLRAALDAAGFAGSRTHLASGNVMLEQDDVTPEAIERVIADAFGMQVDVILRTGPQLAAALSASPFADVATDGAKHFVAFSAGPIDVDVVEAKLGGTDWGEERWTVRGREMYLWLPDGMGRSALAVAAGKPPLGPATTVRNANTIAKLVTMAT